MHTLDSDSNFFLPGKDLPVDFLKVLEKERPLLYFPRSVEAFIFPIRPCSFLNLPICPTAAIVYHRVWYIVVVTVVVVTAVVSRSG